MCGDPGCERIEGVAEILRLPERAEALRDGGGLRQLVLELVGRRYDGILLDPPKFGRGPEGEIWRLEDNLAPLLTDCRKLLDADSRFLVLTVYAVRMSALAIGELVKQTLGNLGGNVEVGEMAVREEARGLLLPTAIFARWSKA